MPRPSTSSRKPIGPGTARFAAENGAPKMNSQKLRLAETASCEYGALLQPSEQLTAYDIKAGKCMQTITSACHSHRSTHVYTVLLLLGVKYSPFCTSGVSTAPEKRRDIWVSSRWVFPRPPWNNIGRLVLACLGKTQGNCLLLSYIQLVFKMRTPWEEFLLNLWAGKFRGRRLQIEPTYRR